MATALTPQIAKALRDLVASAIAGEKSYNVPAVCRRFGLADGTDEEAHRSKFTYVSNRTKELRSDQVLELAKSVQADMPSYALGEVLAKLDEHGQHHVTELTRRRIVTALDGIPLSGMLPAIEFLGKVWPLNELPAPQGSLEQGMLGHLTQHFCRNDDMDTRDVVEALDIYSCSQRQFFRFLEALTDPLTREAPDQYDLATRINRHLMVDGFTLKEVGRLSGSPRFAVRTVTDGTTPADDDIGKALAAFNPTEIHARWEEALKRRSNDPRAAITLARTILEDTCKWIIHEAGKSFKEEDDLPTLYRNLAKILKLAPDDHTEQVFKQILGNCQSIVESLGAIRNKLGDAHSQGPKRAKPQTRHAELAVNLAGTMATFLIATWEARSLAEASAKEQAVG
jgi:hypothetical protein